ncbi:hypothetical protein SAMN05446935_8541 [Burkholderia sp. YR290]|nr:hypothetical protein SAMN05446935_8541 [Burkholderia sp. YR290]
MPAKRKSAFNSTEPLATPHLTDGLKLALAPVATALEEELARLLAPVLDGRRVKTRDRLAEALNQALPEALSKAFRQELLSSDSDARARRATLMYLLSAVDVPSSPLRPKMNAPVESSPVATAADDVRVSGAEVAKLLHLSPSYVRKLATAGKLGDVGSTASGETMFELRAVHAYQLAEKRRHRKGVAKND